MSQPPHQKPRMDETVGKRITHCMWKPLKCIWPFFPSKCVVSSNTSSLTLPEILLNVLWCIYNRDSSATLIGKPVYLHLCSYLSSQSGGSRSILVKSFSEFSHQNWRKLVVHWLWQWHRLTKTGLWWLKWLKLLIRVFRPQHHWPATVRLLTHTA